MFCGNCGKEIPNGFPSCPYCDNSSAASSESKNIPIAPDPFGMPPTTPKRNGNGKKNAIIASISAVVVAVIAIVLVLIFSGGDMSSTKREAKGYIREVEDYLDFLAFKKVDPKKFISDLYLGGEFGVIFCTDDTMSEHEIILEAMYEGDWNRMYYGYEKCDNWEEYISTMINDEIYDSLENRFGKDWKLIYDRTASEELSNSEVEDLIDDKWENVIEYYAEDFADAWSDNCTRREVKKIEDLAQKMRSWELETAYHVEVEVKITGKSNSYIKNTFDFKVAQVSDEWVILDGPDTHELF